MRLLAVVAVLVRLVVWVVLLLWWVVRLAKGLILAIGDTLFYLPRLLIGGVLRPLGHPYALIAVAIAIIIIGARDPRLQNPTFYLLFAGGLLVCFLSGKFGRAVLPKSAPNFSGTFPPLPGRPSWPPMPKARPRVAKAPRPTVAAGRQSVEKQGGPLPTMPVRPAPSGVRVMASGSMVPSPSEAETVAALPEALQRLMRSKDEQVSGEPTVQEANG